MSGHSTKVAVLGCGSWGTSLANHLTRAGHSVTLWGNEPTVLSEIAEKGTNFKYFPKDKLSVPIPTTVDIGHAVRGAELVAVVVPSFAVRSVVHSIREHISADTIVVDAAKGLEQGTLKFLGEVIAEELGSHGRTGVISGPTFALEVLRGLPTAVTLAAYDSVTAQRAAEIFHHEYFRVYTSTDVIGVEVGGAVKNVIALAVGMADGLGMGSNARAALITRGLAEITRLAVALGGDRSTVAGLSGLGDLLLTSTGDLSRNRTVGVSLGKGESLPEILKRVGQVAEGVEAAPKVVQLAKKLSVSMPISESVVEVLEGRATVVAATKTLLSRAKTSEN